MPPMVDPFNIPSASYDSPPGSRVMSRQPSDVELEHMRRAPRKGERPEHIKALHEEAAEYCAANLFNDSCSYGQGSPSPFSLTVQQQQPQSQSQTKQKNQNISQMANQVTKITSLR